VRDWLAERAEAGWISGVQTFREQVPGVLDRYQRRTTRLTGQVRAVARPPNLYGAGRRARKRYLPAGRVAVAGAVA